ncbi:MAG: mechanosensitive ion channel [Thermoplasmatales archaeon]|nr:mechanosensitive ion channel [Thermoplasmatales archaeon]
MDMQSIVDLLSTKIPVVGITVGNVITALIVIIVGYFVTAIISKYVRKVMIKAKLAEILAEFTYRIVKVILLIFVFSIAIGFLGVDVGAALVSISVVFGLVFGLAFQDVLGNLTAGFMIAITKPFKKGDYVDVAGLSGSIANVGISITTLITLDNKRVIIPNSKVWGAPIINYTALKTRRVDMSVGISYSDDINKAITIAMNLLKNHKDVLKDPAPMVAVDELADSSVNLVIRPWVKTEDYWTTKWELTQKIKESFDKEEISIPFPQTDVHLFQNK